MSASTMPTTLCSAKASYKKQAGTLELTDSHLTWTQEGKKASSVRVANSEATCQFKSLSTTHNSLSPSSPLLQQGRRRSSPPQARAYQ